jgi:hypothetical protein
VAKATAIAGQGDVLEAGVPAGGLGAGRYIDVRKAWAVLANRWSCRRSSRCPAAATCSGPCRRRSTEAEPAGAIWPVNSGGWVAPAQGRPAEAVRQVGGQGLGHRGRQVVAPRAGVAEGGVGHAGREDDLVGHQLLERLAGDVGDRRAGQGRAVVGVGRQQRRARAPGADAPGADTRTGGDAAGVRSNSWPRARSSKPGVWVIRSRRRTWVFLPWSFSCRARAGRGSPVRPGACGPASISFIRAIQVNVLEIEATRNRVLSGSTGLRWSEVGEAVALLQHHLAVLDDRQGDAGDVVAGHGAAHDAVDEGFQLGVASGVVRSGDRRDGLDRGAVGAVSATGEGVAVASREGAVLAVSPPGGPGAGA